MQSKESILKTVVRAFEDALGIQVDDPAKAIIDDATVSSEIRGHVQEVLKVSLWPKDRETVKEYADRISITLGAESESSSSEICS